jgi:hypothetical protein
MPNMTKQFTTEDHRRFFAEFCRWELASGGPDSQLPTVAEMANSPGVPEDERLWRAFCYIGVYNVPYGEVIWDHYSLETMKQDPDDLRAWLDLAYVEGKITTRIERRSARRSDWMFGYLTGARRFIDREWQALKDKCASMDPELAYEVAWQKVLEVPTVGRYAAIKLIEYMRRFLGLKVSTPDIRPKDAWSPRHTLGYIFPDRGLGNKSNTDVALAMARQSCEDAIKLLHQEYGVVIDMFQLQVLLCEYRESWESRKQYPGRSLDSELGYARKAEYDWGHRSKIWVARQVLFPHEHLGELRGWEGTRKEVGQCLNNHRYTWTDMLYDYSTTTNMAKPMKWEPRNDENL